MAINANEFQKVTNIEVYLDDTKTKVLLTDEEREKVDLDASMDAFEDEVMSDIQDVIPPGVGVRIEQAQSPSYHEGVKVGGVRVADDDDIQNYFEKRCADVIAKVRNQKDKWLRY